MKKMFKRMLAGTIIAGTMIGSASALIFSDVGYDDWYWSAVNRASDAGYMQGDPDGTFRPNSNITRAEAAVLLDRMADPDAPFGQEMHYEDVAAGAWYQVAAGGPAQMLGGVKVVNDNTPDGYTAYYYPDKACTREDFAYGLANVLNIPMEYGNAFDDWQDMNPDYQDAIVTLKMAGIINGDPVTDYSVNKYGNFRPKDTITRAEVAQIVCNYLDWDYDRKYN